MYSNEVTRPFYYLLSSQEMYAAIFIHVSQAVVFFPRSLLHWISVRIEFLEHFISNVSIGFEGKDQI